MEIESTPLFREATTIMTSGATSANVSWKCRIHYGDTSYLDPIMTEAVSVERDYREAFSDIKIVTVKMGLGDYARLIYPNRTNLQITLTLNPFLETGSGVNANKKIQSERYTAVLIDGPTSATIGQGTENNDIEGLNLSQIVDVHFQLYEKSIEQLRVALTGGLQRTATVGTVLKTILSSALTTANISDKGAITGVDMYAEDNLDVKTQIIIPHGVRLVDCADFLQSRYGIYNSGIGTYVQNRMWYVYPMYDTTKFKKQTKTLTINVLPKRKYSGIERTFLKTGDSVSILATSDTSFKDDSGTQYINYGNGVRFANASTLASTGVTTANNKAVISRGENNAEFISEKVTSGVNHAPISTKRITSNPFAEMSFLAAKKGGMFKCTWQNSDASLLYPGMGVRIVYSNGNNIQSVYGILHTVNQLSYRASGFTSDRFMNNCVLGVFVNNQVVNFDQ